MTTAPPANIAVLGAGLLGGSLLAALRKKSPTLHLRAWARRAETVQEVTHLHLADIASTDLDEVTDGAELVILCTPVETMAGLAKKLNGARVAPKCVVTDVGSVKTPLVTALEDILAAKKIAFIGSHPMAGSEKSGLENSRPDLFEGASCLITPTLFTPEIALDHARWLWTLAGGRVLEMSPEDHDRKIASISHMPHLAAVAVATASLLEDPGAAICMGNGFRDTTRIASGDPELWTGIISQNRVEVLAALSRLQTEIGKMHQVIEQGDDKALCAILDQAKSLRDHALQC